MIYSELLADLHPKSHVQAVITDLVRRKQDLNESDLVDRNPFLSEWIDTTLVDLKSRVPDKSDRPDWSVYNQAFRDLLASG